MVKSHTRQFIHLLLHKPRAHSSHALFKHIVYGPAHYESFVAHRCTEGRRFNWPFAASHSRGTKPPRWRAKVALGQDKQKTYII